MIGKVSAFYDQFDKLMNDINSVIAEEKSFGAVDAVGKEVDKTNRGGQGLIQSAAPGVNTGIMEKDLEKLNDLWNSLKSAIADRERKLDQGLLNSGKLQEAMSGLKNWFDEMDEMFANQKPPSSDHKVIKAQIQEQKFVERLLKDRKRAVDNLIKT